MSYEFACVCVQYMYGESNKKHHYTVNGVVHFIQPFIALCNVHLQPYLHYLSSGSFVRNNKIKDGFIVFFQHLGTGICISFPLRLTFLAHSGGSSVQLNDILFFL